MTFPRPLVRGLALAVLLLSTAGAACAEDPAPEAAAEEAVIPWVRDWNAAKAQAKSEGKDLLIDFTGSDWCGWCKRLEGEVFSQASFLAKATKQFVFVFLDFPRSPELKKAVVDPKLNDELNQQYGVQGFPTIVLATAEGLPYGRTGYREGGPDGYSTHLDELRASGDKIKAMIAKGKGDDAVFKAGFEALAEAEFLGYPGYAWTMAHAESKDADGSKGLKALVEKERARQAAEAEQKALMELVRGARSKEDVPWAKVHEFLKSSKHLAGQMLFQVSMGVGDWLAEQGKPEEAKAMYLLPLRDPELAQNAQLKEFVEKKAADCAKPPEAPEEAPKEEGAPK